MKKSIKMLITISGVIVFAIIAFFFFIRNSFGYATENGDVIYRYYDSVNFKKAQRKLIDADPATFKSFGFSKVFGKDKYQVYLEGYQIKDADPASFEILEGLYKYARDAENLYAHTKRIGGHPDTYEYLGNGIAKNKIHVFKQGKVVKGADATTFELLDEKGYWSRDAEQMFYQGYLIEGSHSPSFKQLEHKYAIDKNNIYHIDNILQGADRGTFEILGDRYARDIRNVYYEDKIIADASASSFEVLANGDGKYYAKDQNRKYWYGKEVEKFPDSINIKP